MPQLTNGSSPTTANVQATHPAQRTQGMNSTDAGSMLQQMDRFFIHMPALLPGIRCFVDASTTHDHSSPSARNASIGILFVNTQVQPLQTIYIKAALSQTHSVIMAEAAALALAAMLADRLEFTDIFFLSDCSQLVHFFNAEDHNHPPDWRMKPFTQIFHNFTTRRRAKLYRISRNLNTTADALARQAFSVPATLTQSPVTACSYTSHGSLCPLLHGLNSVNLHCVTIIAASCC